MLPRLTSASAHSTGNLYGLEKFWAFLKFRKDKRAVVYGDELAQILASFTTLEDFQKAGEVGCASIQAFLSLFLWCG